MLFNARRGTSTCLERNFARKTESSGSMGERARPPGVSWPPTKISVSGLNGTCYAALRNRPPSTLPKTMLRRSYVRPVSLHLPFVPRSILLQDLSTLDFRRRDNSTFPFVPNQFCSRRLTRIEFCEDYLLNDYLLRIQLD